jgi:hypothetical protein
LSRLRRHLTYSNVMVTVLAFIVLGGTAFAVAKLGKNTVGSKQLKAGAVHTADIADGAVTAGKLAGATTTVRSATATVPLTCTETTFSPTNSTLFCSGQKSLTVPCEPGEHATGGGFTPSTTSGSPSSSTSQLESRPDPTSGTPTGWYVNASGFGSNSGTSPVPHPPDPQFTAYAVCST